MTSGSIDNNISTLLSNPSAIRVKVSIKYLAENIEQAITNPDFFKIDYEKYGNQIISQSNIPNIKKEEIRQQFLNLHPSKNIVGFGDNHQQPETTSNQQVQNNYSQQSESDNSQPAQIIDFDDDNDEQIDNDASILPQEIDYTYLKCSTCEEHIPSDAYIYDGNAYHQHCVKCLICGRTILKTNLPDDFVCITTGLFLCLQHYNEYLINGRIPDKYLQKYNERNKKNFIEELFPSQDKIKGGIQVKKPYEYFLPTVKLHFDKELETVDLQKIKDAIGDEASIINIEKGSIIITLAVIKSVIDSGKTADYSEITDNIKKSVAEIEKKVTSLGEYVVGNLIGSEVTIPTDKKIDDLYQRPSINVLQNMDQFNEVEMKKIIDYVIQDVKEHEDIKNFEFIRDNYQMFDEAERRIKEDIYNSPYEMIILGQTIIPNQLIKDYLNKKSSIDDCNIIEKFLYHGTSVQGNFGIINKNFIAGKNNHYGVGIYTTSRLHSALGYAESRSKINGIGFVLMCKTFFNKSYIYEIKDDKDEKDKLIGPNIINNFGINYFSKKKYYVFPNTEQVVPICSFKIMRADHLILWKDDNIHNFENSKYLKYLSEKMQMNVYHTSSNEEGLKIAKRKKNNRIKLITNAGIKAPDQVDTPGKMFIDGVRNLVHSNFICLVFANSLGHIEWVSKMENVLLTNNPKHFREFAALKFEDDELEKFVGKIESDYKNKLKFNINKKTWLEFNLTDKMKKKLNL